MNEQEEELEMTEAKQRISKAVKESESMREIHKGPSGKEHVHLIEGNIPNLFDQTVFEAQTPIRERMWLARIRFELKNLRRSDGKR